MGTFVLGVLVGWLAEWLFFTFWVKDKSDDDCNYLKDEITTLKSKLAVIEKTTKSSSSNTASTNVTTSGSSPSTVQKAVSGASGKSIAKTSTSSKSTAAKSATTNKSNKTKTAGTNKTTAAKATTAKKSAVAKPKAEKKVSSKKTTTTEKPSTKPSAKKSVTKPSIKKTTTNKVNGDDFTKLSGIGPSMAATLKELGIDSYTKLAAMDDDILRDMLEATGARLNNNKEAMDSWNEQATLAANGDFNGLKRLQEELKK